MSAGPRDQKIVISVVYVLALFMSIMDSTIVNVTLPRIAVDLRVGTEHVGLISQAYMVSLAVIIPSSGWLGDRFGGKRVLLTALAIFTTASILCGIASSFGQLVAFRVVQGVGGGMLVPVGLAMLYRTFPPAERVRLSSRLVLPTAVAPALGPVLGGLLTTSLSWRWAFYVNVPIGLSAFVFGLAFLSEPDRTPVGAFDVKGFLLSAVGFASLTYGASEGARDGWRHGPVVASLGVGVVCIVVLVVQQLRLRHPLLNLRLFVDPLFRSAVGSMVVGAGAFLGYLYLTALFLQDGLGVSPLISGLATFPEAVGVMLGSQLASRSLYARFGPRRLMSVGMLIVAAGMGSMAMMDEPRDLWLIRVLMFVLGLAWAHVLVPTQIVAFTRISPIDTGGASTLFSALRQLGGAVGIAVLTSVIAAIGVLHRVDGAIAPNLRSYHVAFLVAAGLAVAAALVASTIRHEDAVSTRSPAAKW